MYRKAIICLGAFFMSLSLLFAAGDSSAHAQNIPSMTADGLVELLDANQDKVVVVNIFASWCGPCMSEMPGLVEVRKKYSADQVFMIGVSVDYSIQDVEPLLGKFGLNYPIYIAGDDFSDELGIESIPINFIFAPGVEAVYSGAGALAEEDLIQHIDGALSMAR